MKSNNLLPSDGHDSQMQMHLGNMAKAREADKGPTELLATRDTNFYCGILAGFDPKGSWFIMLHEAAGGFSAMGIAVKSKGTE